MIMSKETDLLLWIPKGERTKESVIAWWEIRRPVYNIIVFLFYIVGNILLYKVLDLFPTGEVYYEFTIFAIIFDGILVNICYTVGWVVDCLLPEKYADFGGKRSLYLWIAGTEFSVLMCFAPAVSTYVFGPP